MVSWAEWAGWNGSYRLLPYVRKLSVPEHKLLPIFWDRVWADASPYACILESGKDGRYTIAGLHPVAVIEGKGRSARILEPIGGKWQETARQVGEPLDVVRRWLSECSAPEPAGLPDCCGGAVGFWSYDVVRSLEKLPEQAADDLELADYLFQRFEQLWIVDHLDNAVYFSVHTAVATGTDRLGAEELADRFREAKAAAVQMEVQWHRWCAIDDDPSAQVRRREMIRFIEDSGVEIEIDALPDLDVSFSRPAFEQAVLRIREYIAQGDVFQVNLSLRQSRPTILSPEDLYEWLRLVNPSPFMGLLRSPSFALVSASPELLVKLDGGRLSTRPIAGTRRRGRTPEEDLHMENELLSSEKERAEHVMLVDLERNDLGRVAEYGSVHVPELLTVERYSHVMHLVSQVEARLAPDKDLFDVLAAVFPGGTITGAPKIRTMEIIEELEPVLRGAYTGSMGWIDYAGNMQFNIIIRTVTLADGIGHMQAGAGIVIDSDPGREYNECLNKAKALWKAVEHGQRFAGRQQGAPRAAP